MYKIGFYGWALKSESQAYTVTHWPQKFEDEISLFNIGLLAE